MEAAGHTFDYSISTDGISISITMLRQKSSSEEEKPQMQRLKTKYENGAYSKEIGMDPGARLMFGAAIHNMQNGRITQSNYKDLRRKTNAFNRHLPAVRTTGPDFASPMAYYIECIRFELQKQLAG